MNGEYLLVPSVDDLTQAPPLKESAQDRLFRLLDVDMDGLLSRQDFESYLCAFEGLETMPDENFNQLITTYDAKGQALTRLGFNEWLESSIQGPQWEEIFSHDALEAAGSAVLSIRGSEIEIAVVPPST